ncbi:hypothetical protein K502DRAFT_354084 [Neoconidiobolus thromboides FSU 785]|nr:hypothetical protein K502DRAFT_354084 [Neoconidiobolus thromboides FSU 785]
MISLTLALIYVLVTLISYWAYKVIYNLFFSPLRKVPGPLINQIFPLASTFYAVNGTFHLYSTKLHQKYGNVVRISWDGISIASDEAAKEVYSTYSFAKSGFYNGFQIAGETVFSTR